MAAIIDIISFHGASGVTQTSVKNTEARFKLADNDTADVLNPLQIPSSGSAYSWHKSMKLKVISGLSGGGYLADLIWYADPMPTDWNNVMAMHVATSTGYLLATAGNESALIMTMTNADSYSVSTPLSVQSGIFITQNSSFGNQPYLVQQIETQDTATSGIKTARGCAYRYNEV